jgi:hypothetical protein
MTCHEIDAEFFRQLDEIAPGEAVALGEPIDQLLNTGRGLGDYALAIALSEGNLSAKRAFEERLEVGRN